MEHKVTKQEIEELCNTINRIEKRNFGYYLGVGLGAFISLISLVYFLINPDIVAGSLSLLAIGVFVIILNYISIKQAKARITQLKVDLERLQEVYNNQIEF